MIVLAGLIFFGKSVPEAPVVKQLAEPTPPPHVESRETIPPISAPIRSNPGALTQEEVVFVNDLALRLRTDTRSLPTDGELVRIESICGAHPDDNQLRSFLIGLYMRRAVSALSQNYYARTERYLNAMRSLDSRDSRVFELEANFRLAEKDWPAVDAAVRNYEQVASQTGALSYALAVSLERRGLRDEAKLVLSRPILTSCQPAVGPMETRAYIESQSCSRAADLLWSLGDRLPKPEPTPIRVVRGDDPTKETIESERFAVRFDGETQNGVARDVLFVLNRAYQRLADIYHVRPMRKVPVVLHSEQDFHTKAGAPWWVGGMFSSHTGFIDVPIRGMPSSLPREMEGVFIHELSHAFVNEMSGGHAGRELQEGLAQYMEGKRTDQWSGEARKSLEDERRRSYGQPSLAGTYMGALDYVERLIRSRGQSTVNDLLLAMKETGSQEGAYIKVLGQRR